MLHCMSAEASVEAQGGLRAIEEEWALSIGTCVSLICGGMSPACGATEHTHVYGVLYTFTFTNTFMHTYTQIQTMNV